MAQIDEQKEIVNGLKTAVFFFLTTLFGLFAYVFQNYKTFDFNKNLDEMIILYIVIIANLVVFLILLDKYINSIKKLKDM
jgi:hypothetical protein